jgi:predicted translin family RNA/ssDNA-binding protein
MFQKDYILRMIEMIGDLIATLLGLIKKGDLEQAEKILERGYMELLRKEAAFFQAIPKDQLTTLLIEEHNYEHGHLEILAELFFAEATLSEAQQKMSYSLKCYEKSLILLEFLEEEDKTWSAKREERIVNIKNRIRELTVS